MKRIAGLIKSEHKTTKKPSDAQISLRNAIESYTRNGKRYFKSFRSFCNDSGIETDNYESTVSYICAFKDKFLSMQSLDNYNNRQMTYAEECERISIMHDMGDYSEDYSDSWCSPYDLY